MNIQAIETQYKGYRFRSRLEARWAVFFDACDIAWEYEKEGYELSNGTRYLPDFWLPKFNVFIEIKGEKPTQEERDKSLCLSSDTDYPVFTVIGMPDRETEFIISTEHKKMNYIFATFAHYLVAHREQEIYKSRSARFEFGEVG